MKEITGKQKAKSNLLSREIKVDKTIIQNPQETAKEFNKFLLLLDQHWWEKSPILKNHFKAF